MGEGGSRGCAFGLGAGGVSRMIRGCPGSAPPPGCAAPGLSEPQFLHG